MLFLWRLYCCPTVPVPTITTIVSPKSSLIFELARQHTALTGTSTSLVLLVAPQDALPFVRPLASPVGLPFVELFGQRLAEPDV